jgi:hypothetical protein
LLAVVVFRKKEGGLKQNENDEEEGTIKKK